jgi:hypothetical protein
VPGELQGKDWKAVLKVPALPFETKTEPVAFKG